MRIESTAFAHNGDIPSKYTCDGENINPPLVFAEVPKEARSLTLIMHGPDVPTNLRPDRNFDHWVVFNIPPETTIGEGELAPGVYGLHTRGKPEYYGPCPPDREHRYFFKLYALDSTLSLPGGSTKAEVEAVMEGHVLGQTE